MRSSAWRRGVIRRIAEDGLVAQPYGGRAFHRRDLAQARFQARNRCRCNDKPGLSRFRFFAHREEHVVAPRPDQVFALAFRRQAGELGSGWFDAAAAFADQSAKTVGPDDRIEGFRIVERVCRLCVARSTLVKAALVAKQCTQDEEIDAEQIVDDAGSGAELVFGAHQLGFTRAANAVGSQHGGENADRQQSQCERDGKLKRQRAPCA